MASCAALTLCVLLDFIAHKSILVGAFEVKATIAVEDPLGESIADDVLCPFSLIQTSLRQVGSSALGLNNHAGGENLSTPETATATVRSALLTASQEPLLPKASSSASRNTSSRSNATVVDVRVYADTGRKQRKKSASASAPRVLARHLPNADYGLRGWRVRGLKWAAKRDARVAVMLAILVILLAITTVMSVRSLSVGMRRRGESSPKERAVKAIPLCSVWEVERTLPSIGGSYDCALARPASAGRPLRLQARIVGPLAGGATLVAPLSQRACVCYEASVTVPGRRGQVFARCARSVDFIVSLADAPQVQVELRGEEVSLFSMCGGLQLERCTLAAAAESWLSFAAAHRVTGGDGDGPSTEDLPTDQVLEFREVALLEDSVVTLVGDLHRGVTGTLSLWPCHGETGEPKQKEPVLPDRGVLEPWRTSWERPVCKTAEEADEDEELHFGAVLASDDPALLSSHEREQSPVWHRLGESAGKALAQAPGVLGPGHRPGWQLGMNAQKPVF